MTAMNVVYDKFANLLPPNANCVNPVYFIGKTRTTFDGLKGWLLKNIPINVDKGTVISEHFTPTVIAANDANTFYGFIAR